MVIIGRGLKSVGRWVYEVKWVNTIKAEGLISILIPRLLIKYMNLLKLRNQIKRNVLEVLGKDRILL